MASIFRKRTRKALHTDQVSAKSGSGWSRSSCNSQMSVSIYSRDDEGEPNVPGNLCQHNNAKLSQSQSSTTQITTLQKTHETEDSQQVAVSNPWNPIEHLTYGEPKETVFTSPSNAPKSPCSNDPSKRSSSDATLIGFSGIPSHERYWTGESQPSGGERTIIKTPRGVLRKDTAGVLEDKWQLRAESVLQYHFQNPDLLEEALETAGSGTIVVGRNRSCPDGNRELAEVGQAVMELVLKDQCYIFNIYKGKSPSSHFASWTKTT